MEDEINGRQPQWKKNSVDVDLSEGRPHQMITLKDDNLIEAHNGRQPSFFLDPNFSFFVKRKLFNNHFHLFQLSRLIWLEKCP